MNSPIYIVKSSNSFSDVAALSSDEDEDDMLVDVFEKPGVIEDVLTATVCRVLYDFSATSDAMLDVRSGDTVTLLSDCLISDTWAYVKRGNEIPYISLYTMFRFLTGRTLFTL